MGHHYHNLGRLVGRWLRRETKGPRIDGDICCEPTFDDRDEALYWRRHGYSGIRPFAWRVRAGIAPALVTITGETFFALKDHGDRRYSAVAEAIEVHCKENGGRFCALALSGLLPVLGIHADSFHGRACGELILVDLIHSQNLPMALLEFRGRRVLMGHDNLYPTEFYVEVSPAITTVGDALASLEPKAIHEAKESRAPYFRHGNWYLVRRAAEVEPDVRACFAKDFALPEGGEFSRHTARFGYESDGRLWISGMLTHPRFHRLQLDGLWEAIPSLAVNRAAC